MIPWQPLNCYLAGLQPAHSCLLPASNTTALAGSQAVAVSQNVMALVSCIQLGVCEPVAQMVQSPGAYADLYQCRDIYLFLLSLSGCFTSAQLVWQPPGLEAKDFKPVRLAPQGIPGPVCLGHSREGPIPGNSSAAGLKNLICVFSKQVLGTESGSPSLLLLLKSLMMPCLSLWKSLRCNSGTAPVCDLSRWISLVQ